MGYVGMRGKTLLGNREKFGGVSLVAAQRAVDNEDIRIGNGSLLWKRVYSGVSKSGRLPGTEIRTSF